MCPTDLRPVIRLRCDSHDCNIIMSLVVLLLLVGLSLTEKEQTQSSENQAVANRYGGPTRYSELLDSEPSSECECLVVWSASGLVTPAETRNVMKNTNLSTCSSKGVP